MSWSDFDCLGSESSEFSIETRDLVLQVFVMTSRTLDIEWGRFQKRHEERMTKMTDQGDLGYAGQEMDWEERLQRQRMQAIGALALDWLMCLLHQTLHSPTRYFNSSHPREPSYGSKSWSWLDRTATEYRDRFGIDFKALSASFVPIEELVLARNAGIHRTDGSMTAYLNRIQQPRFVDDRGEFLVTEKALVAVVQDCEKFVGCVVAELKRLRSSKPAEA